MESKRITREAGKGPRVKSMLKKSLVVVMRSVDFDTLLSSELPRDSNGWRRHLSSITCVELFNSLKSENQRRVNARLTESLNEVCLSGWISPSTLLINGPNEDLRVIKQSWHRRSLRNPPGFVIQEVGSVEDVVVETIQQAQFMSLSTAVLEALIDLNKCNIYPTSSLMTSYLRVCHVGVQLPEEEVVLGCLETLVSEGKASFRGRGYVACLDEDDGLDITPQHFDETDEPDVARFDVTLGRARLGRESQRGTAPLDKLLSGDDKQSTTKPIHAKLSPTSQDSHITDQQKRSVSDKRDGLCVFSCVAMKNNTMVSSDDEQDTSMRPSLNVSPPSSSSHYRKGKLSNVVHGENGSKTENSLLTSPKRHHHHHQNKVTDNERPIKGRQLCDARVPFDQMPRQDVNRSKNTQRKIKTNNSSRAGDSACSRRQVTPHTTGKLDADGNSIAGLRGGELFARIIVNESERLLQEHRCFARGNKLRRSLPLPDRSPSVAEAKILTTISGDNASRHLVPTPGMAGGQTSRKGVAGGSRDNDRVPNSTMHNPEQPESLVADSCTHEQYYGKNNADMTFIGVL